MLEELLAAGITINRVAGVSMGVFVGADLVINPRNEGVGLLEFHRLERAREAGRRAAQAALGQAPPSLFT